MTPLLAVGFLAAAAGASAVVAARDPRRQVVVLSIYGSILGLLFFFLQAPDVALSEIAVGSVALPLFVVLAISKVKALAASSHPGGGSEHAEGAGGPAADPPGGGRS